MWTTTPITLFFLVALMPWLDPPGVLSFHWNFFNTSAIFMSAVFGFLLQWSGALALGWGTFCLRTFLWDAYFHFGRFSEIFFGRDDTLLMCLSCSLTFLDPERILSCLFITGQHLQLLMLFLDSSKHVSSFLEGTFFSIPIQVCQVSAELSQLLQGWPCTRTSTC